MYTIAAASTGLVESQRCSPRSSSSSDQDWSLMVMLRIYVTSSWFRNGFPDRTRKAEIYSGRPLEAVLAMGHDEIQVCAGDAFADPQVHEAGAFVHLRVVRPV